MGDEQPTTVFAERRALMWATPSVSVHDVRFVSAIVRLGWSVVVVTFNGFPPELGPKLEASPYVVAPKWRGWHDDVLVDFDLEGVTLELQHLTERYNPLLIHGGPLTSVAKIVGEATKLPVVAMSWGYDLLRDVQVDGSALRNARASIGRAAFVHVDSFVGASAALRLGASPEQIFYLPWGVEASQLAPRPVPLPAAGLKFLSARSLEAVYDVETTLKGFAKALPTLSQNSVKLLLAGGGSEQSDLHATAEDLGVSSCIEWVGVKSEQELESLMREADCYISSSLVDGTSVTLLQAMAAGTPVIVSQVGGNPEWVIPNATGRLFPAGDAGALGEEIEAFAADRQHSHLMAEAASISIHERANWALNYPALNRLYAAAIGSR